MTASSNRNDTYLAAATELVATANHPVLTDEGKKAIGNLKAGDVLYHFNQMTHEFERYQVFLVKRNFETVKEVYNLTTNHGNYIVNGMVVSEK